MIPVRCFTLDERQSIQVNDPQLRSADEITITMKRRSTIWWLAMLPTSVIVGGTTFLVVGHFAHLTVIELVVVAVGAALAADLAIAAAMEAIAPTKVNIGPGEKLLISDIPTENATIISGFNTSAQGHVSVRGETWRAIRASDDTHALSPGMVVNVVDRNGLTLVVSTRPGW